MIYRSNLTCPDLTPHFRHLVSRPMGHSFGHDVPSDWGDKAADDPVFRLYKNCGMWTHDEAAILYNVALTCGGSWVDIGAHTGWTSAHIASGIASRMVTCVEPMFGHWEFLGRFFDNTSWSGSTWVIDPAGGNRGLTSAQFFADPITQSGERWSGVCIDGDHSEGKPLEDAKGALRHLAETGVIMFHDGVGRPVQEAVEWLMGHEPDCAYVGSLTNEYDPDYPCQCGRGFKARAYFTPHLVFCCWRGDFVPPDHEPDPEVKRQLLDGRFRDFDFTRMS